MKLTTAMLVLLSSAYAQLTRGYISGTVFDPSGAEMQGVKIEATHLETKLPRETFTNESGIYRLAGLEPGVYDLKFSRDRFTPQLVEGVTVLSAEEAVVNRTLTLASQAAEVAVVSEVIGAGLARATATLERILGPETFEKVPLGGTRDVTYLMALSPTVVRVPPRPEFHYVASGQRAGRTEFIADGLDNRAPQLDFAQWRPLPEQVSEFQVKSNAYSAEFGRGAGVVVLAVSRSGGNQFHATLWDYYSANWIAAQTLSNKRAGLDLPRFQEHHAGASLGGPIRRDRTFFFTQVQSKPLSSGFTTAFSFPVTVPTPVGFEVLSRVPLGDGQTPESRQAVLSSLAFLQDAHRLVGRYESIRNIAVNGVAVEVGTAQIPAPNYSNFITGLGRLDHRLTSRDFVTFRLQAEDFDEDLAQGGRAALSNAAFGRMFASRDHARNISWFASHTHSQGAAALNELRFGVLSTDFDSDPIGDRRPYSLVLGWFNFGPIPVVPWRARTRNLQWQDVLTTQRGKHSLKLGVDINRISNRLANSNFTPGLFVFAGLQDLINNQPVAMQYQQKTSVESIDQTQQAYFVQDDFRITPNLSWNIGVRYQTAGVPLAGYGTTIPEYRAAGIPQPVQRDTNDVAPRFGFAWSARSKTVVRGGFGIAYEQSLGPQATLASLSTYPQSIRLTIPAPLSFNLFPRVPQGGPSVPPLLPQFYDFVNPASDAKNATTHFYSLAVQHEILRGNVAEIGYIGNRAYHLWRFNEHNPAVLTSGTAALPVPLRRKNPAWASRGVLEAAGFSNYNAGFVRFDRRAGRGLLFGVSYTWSAALDDGEIAPSDPANYRRDYGRSNIDRPHRLSAHYVWTIPSPRRAKNLLGGWQVAGYSEWQSGEPFTVTTGVDSNGDAVVNSYHPQYSPDRPDYNPSGQVSLDSVTANWRSFRDAGIFVTPLAGGMPFPNSVLGGGNLGRNTFRAPAYANTNVSMLKEIALAERWKIELRASWTNLLNHRNFGPPVSVMNSPQFGRNQSNPDSRVTILALKWRF